MCAQACVHMCVLMCPPERMSKGARQRQMERLGLRKGGKREGVIDLSCKVLKLSEDLGLPSALGSHLVLLISTALLSLSSWTFYYLVWGPPKVITCVCFSLTVFSCLMLSFILENLSGFLF